MAGANLIYGSGMLESGMTFDYGQLIMDNEFAKMIKYAVGGIEVNDETLSVDVTEEVGPFKDYLGHKNTFKHMRTQSQPKLLDRKVRAKWEIDGKSTLYDRALAEARHIMDTHEVEPLSDAVQKRLREIVEEAEAELGVKS